MRVFLTGGQGFVGRHLQDALVSAGDEVIAPAHAEVDVLDADSIRRAVDATRPDAIAHLAAFAFAPEVSRHPEAAFRLAVQGTINVIEAARRLVPPPAFLITSSSGVYGPPQPEELPIAEGSPLRPTTPYAISKLAQESVALAQATLSGLPVIVTRSFNHSGPGQHSSFLVPALAGRVLAVAQGRASTIPVGNADVRRDFTHVKDVVRAYRLLLVALGTGRLGQGGAVYNVASGRALSIRAIAEHMCVLANVPCNLWIDPSLVRQGEAPEIRGDATALRLAVGWKPRISVERMIEDVLASVAMA